MTDSKDRLKISARQATSSGNWIAYIHEGTKEVYSCGFFLKEQEALDDATRARAHYEDVGSFDYTGLMDGDF